MSEGFKALVKQESREWVKNPKWRAGWTMLMFGMLFLLFGLVVLDIAPLTKFLLFMYYVISMFGLSLMQNTEEEHIFEKLKGNQKPTK